jgi:aspartate aminotransferase
VAKFRRENGLECRPENISAGAGGKQILYNALMATLDPGDEVLIPAPSWVAYADITSFAEGVPVWIPTRPEDRFKLRPDALERAITRKTKWLMLNSPSNPTGAVYSADELRALAALLERHPSLHIISDDMYEHVFDGGFTTPPAGAPARRAHADRERSVENCHTAGGWAMRRGRWN